MDGVQARIERHRVLGTPLGGPWPAGTSVLYLAMGCFWGAEELYWQVPGVVCTAVGYQGGSVAEPTYEQVCRGATGHAETVLVAYDPTTVNARHLLERFWTHHDPTQGMRQGNDIGTQYRSAVWWTTAEQADDYMRTRDEYAVALHRQGLGPITTSGGAAAAPETPAGFWYAEEPHQQYLSAHPQGYRCHATTGVPFPR